MHHAPPRGAHADVHGDDPGDVECDSGQRVSNVVVGGANFFEDWNGLGFGVAGDYVAFWLETLVEQPAPNTFLSFGGLAAASVTSDASPISLRFSGSIQHCVTKSETGRYLECGQSQARHARHLPLGQSSADPDAAMMHRACDARRQADGDAVPAGMSQL